eukprot:s7526_g1.t1
MQVPPDLCRALESTGIESVPDLAFAYNSTADLDVFLSDKYDELWLGLGITDPAHSPAMARLRRALKRAQNLTELADSPATASPSAPSAPASLNAWAEHAPPRLDASSIAQLVKDFHTNYPGEHLDSDAMPSVRLLSIVHRWFSPGNSISWVPWQLRLSEKQYQELMESKASRTIRTEAAFLSTALFDDTPDYGHLVEAESGRTESSVQTVFRNAIALCKGAHLQRLKAYDKKKILDWATQTPSDASLRTVTTQELVAADRKLWREISLLHSTGWSLDDALHEMTSVRSDVGNLLQLHNTSAESGLNKLFSTAEPLGTFLRLAATWAHLHRVQFEVEHLAGEKNVWADKLSRGNTAFLAHRSAERASISLAQLASASHCVTLHGASMPWPRRLEEAQHAMLR